MRKLLFTATVLAALASSCTDEPACPQHTTAPDCTPWSSGYSGTYSASGQCNGQGSSSTIYATEVNDSTIILDDVRYTLTGPHSGTAEVQPITFAGGPSGTVTAGSFARSGDTITWSLSITLQGQQVNCSGTYMAI